MKALLMIFACLLLFLPACRYLATSPDEFAKISRDYNNMLRWQEFDRANVAYVEQALRGEFQKKIAATRDVKVVDYRVLSLECNAEKGEAEVKVEVDYYLLPAMRLKTVLDQQKWVYREGPGENGWRLVTVLPDFN